MNCFIEIIGPLHNFFNNFLDDNVIDYNYDNVIDQHRNIVFALI